ncbi:DUF2242 domain-containing protein [Undibacterium sp. Jales W-56]|uniref:DUF2242 domain-containing protein n=1 Tax=Undibacterium sp. Jales W-56 TaxID=2897325 RepID=UPI0021CF658E|nr:DUF2242 domain-containing protein [Undibacterium sp. Jales W-56]MCU6432938.1 DUF2242 domain-containing protein [Undibacterium sp. Jales W-56]
MRFLFLHLASSSPRRSIYRLSTVVAALVLTGCGSFGGGLSNNKAHLKDEEFGSADVFTHSFPGTEKTSCEAARRALLSQGYVISESKAAFVKGRRKFQRDSDIHAEIEFTVVCAADSKGSNSTTVFANAVRDRYSLKKSTNSASIGVGALGSVSLPFGASDDSLVKVASETIPTGDFYGKFFELLERYLDDSSVNGDEEAEKKETSTPSGMKKLSESNQ